MNQRSRLLWRCRRGMREMDILFEKFVNTYYDDLTTNDQEIFEQFLDEADVDIYSWIMDRSTPENPAYHNFVNQLKRCL